MIGEDEKSMEKMNLSMTFQVQVIFTQTRMRKYTKNKQDGKYGDDRLL